MNTMVMPVRRQTACSSSCIFSRVSASRAPNGSSIKQHARIVDQRPDDGQALLHPARELVGVAVAEIEQPDHVQPVLDLGASLGPTDAADHRPELGVGGDGHPREQRRLLEHDAAIGAGCR